MTSTATITFSQTGVQPPVYVVTSVSDPPWETLQMEVEDQTASTNLVFSRKFDEVAEGSYQYKIRIGEGHWVVDEMKESASDEHGNRNNVIHVKHTAPAGPSSPLPYSPDKTSGEITQSTNEIRKDSTMGAQHTRQPPSLSIPLATNVKGTDVEQAGAQISSPESAPSKSLDVPFLIVEKTDHNLAYGDDFGETATPAQRVAHNMRIADAEPDELVVLPEHHTEPGTEEERTAPLFRHESFPEEDPSPLASSASVHSSANHSSTGGAVNTPDESEGLDNDDELDQQPLLPHETSFTQSSYNGDELDQAPQFQHEGGSSQYEGSEIRTDSAYTDMERDSNTPDDTLFEDEDDEDCEIHESEFNRAPTFSWEASDDEDTYNDDDDNEAPLLPHERHEISTNGTHSETSSDDRSFSLFNQPTFSHETETSRELFGGNGYSSIFRARTNSSTLPHKMPRFDDDDDNLLDPSLERFPTSRDQILERVATIGLHLPEDETLEDPLHSPQISVLSQACSSVDLAPVKSYTSLASVREEDDDEEEEEHGEEAELEPLPSPVVLNIDRIPSLAKDPHETPLPKDYKQRGYFEENKNDNPSAPASSKHAAQSSEAESVSKTDGARDSAGVGAGAALLEKLQDVIATPSKMPTPITPPLSPNRSAASTGKGSVSVVETRAEGLRQRGMVGETGAPENEAPVSSHKDSDLKKDAPPADLTTTDREIADQGLVSALLQAVSTLVIACLGSRKRARTSAVVAGVAVMAWYIYS